VHGQTRRRQGYAGQASCQWPYQTATIAGSSSGLQVNLPDFARDIAVKLKQMGPALVTSPPSLTAGSFVGHDPASQVFMRMHT